MIYATKRRGINKVAMISDIRTGQAHDFHHTFLATYRPRRGNNNGMTLRAVSRTKYNTNSRRIRQLQSEMASQWT